jgi:hypothetical protein
MLFTKKFVFSASPSREIYRSRHSVHGRTCLDFSNTVIITKWLSIYYC